jgi:hypothetical protein
MAATPLSRHDHRPILPVIRSLIPHEREIPKGCIHSVNTPDNYRQYSHVYDLTPEGARYHGCGINARVIMRLKVLTLLVNRPPPSCVARGTRNFPSASLRSAPRQFLLSQKSKSCPNIHKYIRSAAVEDRYTSGTDPRLIKCLESDTPVLSSRVRCQNESRDNTTNG